MSASRSRFDSRVGVRGEVGVVAVQDAELREQLVVAGVEPVHLVAPDAAGVGEDEGVAAVGLGLARVEVGGAAHDQPGHVRDRHTEARSDGEHEAGERAGLVDDQGRGTQGLGTAEERLDVGLVVGHGAGEQRLARGVPRVSEMFCLADVEADPHVDVIGRSHCGSSRVLRPLVRKAAGARAVIHLTNQRSARMSLSEVHAPSSAGGNTPQAVKRQGALSHAGTAGLPAREATQAAERR